MAAFMDIAIEQSAPLLLDKMDRMERAVNMLLKKGKISGFQVKRCLNRSWLDRFPVWLLGSR
jgi:hypothetical protein